MVTQPLASRLRPQSLDEVVGQQHLLDKQQVFRRTIDNGHIPNMIFYGPSGVGKTTVARIISKNSGMKLHILNGTSASISDIKQVVDEIGTFGTQNGILLYLDEIQYLNKKQQQTLLEYIEDGSITLIASTTENPYFYVYTALLSRCTVFEFKPLKPDDIEKGLQHALDTLQKADNINYTAEEGALYKLAVGSGGDMRKALNGLEFALKSHTQEKENTYSITLQSAKQVTQRSSMRYDREGDEHYDIVSAYQKSMRGSDTDAALHYLARLLDAGDIMSACRRLVVCAAEDVGLAYPQILPIVKSAVDIALQVGMPEAQIPLADAVIMVCLAPKSNSANTAIHKAMEDVKMGKIGPIPRQLQNKHLDGADADIKGQHYQYPHNFNHHWTKQQYLPDNLVDTTYYEPANNKTEQSFKAYWDDIKKDKT